MFINLVILFLFTAGFVYTGTGVRKYSTDQKGVSAAFDRLAAWMMDRMPAAMERSRASRKLKEVIFNEQVAEDLRLLDPAGRGNARLEGYYRSKAAIVLTVLFASNLLALLAGAACLAYPGMEGIMERNEYGGGTVEKDYYVSVEGKMAEAPLSIALDERRYTKEEAEQELEHAEGEVDELVLGENSSKEEVRNSLNFISAIPGRPVTISWETDNCSLVAADGHIVEEKAEEEGTLVKLTALLKCEDQEREYSTYVKIFPGFKSETEELLWKINRELRVEKENSSTETTLKLPEEIDSRKITWKEKVENHSPFIMFAGVLAGAAIFAARDRELHGRTEKRKRQMMIDYPDIVSKLTLLLGAGMTIKAAWQKVATDYREKAVNDPVAFRYAYEEMLVTYYEIQGGIPESRAYDNFGKRCKIHRYLKLSTLLIQNMKKGSRGLAEMLGAEADDAFDERKNQAKRIGEEAGTKLLIPMFLMLVIVLIIVVFPSLMSFSI
ncbi:type II secretion system F family protein [Anaerobium acetethylicum]|uniref:Type II secretion system (T2SS), protein F n=1 Tax=Anaerobium acetethylicum TaxID=1619234 RepID=A0A1D3TRK2_9FIRM|nr:type II secretion system F family protein [Anaerobium acetethylicum]SCP96365.1 Type II secretion system (T2SS), protein F [Anaerobium acetethylicum]